MSQRVNEQRCPWCGDDPQYVAYHDQEWGVPVTDDRQLFGMLVLESAQAGLSWITVLRRREGYRRAFADFDPGVVAGFGEERVESLLQDTGIIRHRGKIESTINNARCLLQLHARERSFGHWLWGFVDGTPIQNRYHSLSEVPGQTALSQTISKALKQQGFRFVGPTTVYAWLQACGVVNDHLVSCFRHAECAALPVSLR